MEVFKNRNVCIVTKHSKELVIQPLLEKSLGVLCFVGDEVDTDLLGAFSGEVERKLDPVSTARQKCLEASNHYDVDLFIASEGSFGNHPNIPFALADDEIILLLDKKNNTEYIEREISAETNFSVIETEDWTDLELFASKIGFPQHGIILKSPNNDSLLIRKDFHSIKELEDGFLQFSKTNPFVLAETDMRAHRNPTRMKVIERATEKLIQKLNRLCPECAAPGFSVKEINRGLPCELCAMPTQSVLSYLHVCDKCQFNQLQDFPFGKETENPMYCDFCNP